MPRGPGAEVRPSRDGNLSWNLKRQEKGENGRKITFLVRSAIEVVDLDSASHEWGDSYASHVPYTIQWHSAEWMILCKYSSKGLLIQNTARQCICHCHCHCLCFCLWRCLFNNSSKIGRRTSKKGLVVQNTTRQCQHLKSNQHISFNFTRLMSSVMIVIKHKY